MPDKALKGNKLTRQRAAGPSMSRRPKPKMKGPPHIVRGKEQWDALERLGIYESGGIEGKPHSTWRGRMEAGRNFLNRAWGQKYDKKKKKKKKEGTEV